MIVDILFEEYETKKREDAEARVANRRARKFQKLNVVWGEDMTME